jgi:hypothetical protein
MSHVATIELIVKDLEALEIACKSLGLELVRDQHTYQWYGRHVGDYPLPKGFTPADLGKCSHAIRVAGNPSAYEVGVVQSQDGYTLLWDFYGSQGKAMQDCIGANGLKLQDAYATQVAISHYQSQGYYVTTAVQEDGQIVLTATR